VSTTPVYEEKVTNFNFAGISIKVIEALDIFKVVFEI
jgi:hypothetical protein